MYYYEVWVNSLAYRSKENLTYHHHKKINQGQIVEVKLRETSCLAIIIKQVSKPKFQTKPIDEIFELPVLPSQIILLAQWLINYYPSSIGVVTKLILPIKLKSTQINKFTSPIFEPKQKIQLPPLTNDQKLAIEKMSKTNTYLLHGVTGSGKTRVYLELIKKEIKINKSVLFLIPEISLISQLTNILQANFNHVVIWHSKQTEKQRLQTWLEILKNDQPQIVLGPRSAIFSPIRHLGLIIIDEAHETAYKQEQAPHYETTRVASYLSRLTFSKLIIGSATPSINDYYLALQKNKPIIELKNKVLQNIKTKHQVHLIDLKDRHNFNQSNYLSQGLINAIAKSIDQGEQSLLYLNRRGSARHIFCQQCGWQANCPNCDTNLTYHNDQFIMRCHICNYQQKPPIACPVCHYSNIIFKTIGTKALETEIKKIFPSAQVARFDNDNLKKDRLENNYQKIIDGQIDILIGTQIVAKGLDILKLSTLGIVIADTSLFLPDYTAEERTFQLINQVIGRVNRGHLNSQTFIQTYQPNNPIIQQAINDDYLAMYQQQIALRQKYFFPPICSILKIVVKKNSRQKTVTEITTIKKQIQLLNSKIIIEGPTPAYHEKINNYYYWQLIIKATKRQTLLTIINHLPTSCSFDIDPINLL